MEKFFKLKANGTNVRTEIIAGVTTFFTMAYIIFVNPTILSEAGMPFAPVMAATCIAAAIGTLLTGLMSNYPFAQAPGMGLNAFFTYTVCMGLGYTWQQALTLVFISGILFIIITLTGLRNMIIKAIPQVLKLSISAGIGLFIAFIGLKGGGIIVWSPADIPSLGNLADPTVILAIVGILISVVLMLLKVRGALLIGIVATTLIGFVCTALLGIPMGIGAPDFSQGFSLNLSETFLKFDFAGLFANGAASIVPFIIVLVSFVMVDMFDTLGTLIGTASKANMLDKDGNLPRGNQALLADAIATSVGACLGTSTVTTYVESTAGVAEGGRTGLTSVVTAILFLLALLAAPIAGMVTSAVTCAALTIVGVLMMSSVKQIDWDDFSDALPAFITIIGMPFFYSIASGIGAGILFYIIAKLVTGQYKKIHPILYGTGVLFIIYFIITYAQTGAA